MDKQSKLNKLMALFIIHFLAVYTFYLLYETKDLKVDIQPVEIVKPTIDLSFLDKKSYEELHADAEAAYKQRAMDLADIYTKKRGDCYKIAINYIKELKGLKNIEMVDIYWWEAEPGDLIYYSNNGYGQTHWAVVLDLENDMALHGSGNWKRETVIRKIFEPNMARPKFYRVKEKE